MARVNESYEDDDDHISIANEEDEENNYLLPEPIIIGADGNTTIFGLACRYNSSFPNALTAKVAKEEFENTMNRVNDLLQEKLSLNNAWWLYGCIFCCCKASCSLRPLYEVNKKAIIALSELFETENKELYNQLGLNWRLSEKNFEDNTMMTEFVIAIDFLPKPTIYLPD